MLFPQIRLEMVLQDNDVVHVKKLSVRKETTENWPEEATKKTVVGKESLGKDAGNNDIKHV